MRRRNTGVTVIHHPRVRPVYAVCTDCDIELPTDPIQPEENPSWVLYCSECAMKHILKQERQT